MRARLLIVEDDPSTGEMLHAHFDAEGFDVRVCTDGTTALGVLQNTAFDLIVLDVMLPGVDGISICRAIRAGGPNVDAAVVIVTALEGEDNRVIGLESGADDYLGKPFGLRELMARIAAITRRRGRSRVAEAGKEQAPAAALSIDSQRRLVTVRGKRVDLTRQEFDVLHRLEARRGVVFSRAALLQSVWKSDAFVTERTVDSVISRLRKKLEENPRSPQLILTAWGVGYKFAEAV